MAWVSFLEEVRTAGGSFGARVALYLGVGLVAVDNPTRDQIEISLDLDGIYAASPWKGWVDAAVLGNTSLSLSSGTLGGVALADGRRFMLARQTDPIENGLYVFRPALGLVRASDALAARDLRGLRVMVAGGDSAGSDWTVSNAGAARAGVDPLTFKRFAGALQDGLTFPSDGTPTIRGTAPASGSSAIVSVEGAPGVEGSTLDGGGVRLFGGRGDDEAIDVGGGSGHAGPVIVDLGYEDFDGATVSAEFQIGNRVGDLPGTFTPLLRAFTTGGALVTISSTGGANLEVKATSRLALTAGASAISLDGGSASAIHSATTHNFSGAVCTAGGTIGGGGAAGTIAINFLNISGAGAASSTVVIFLTGDATISAPTGVTSLYTEYRVIIVQPAMRTFTVTWNAVFKFGSQWTGSVTPLNGAIDMFTFVPFAGNLLCSGTSKGVDL